MAFFAANTAAFRGQSGMFSNSHSDSGEAVERKARCVPVPKKHGMEMREIIGNARRQFLDRVRIGGR